MFSVARRQFIQRLALSGAALPFAPAALQNLALANPATTQSSSARKQRLVIVFSPNGTVPQLFWPAEPGKLNSFQPILKPLEPFRDKTLLLRGVSNKIRGDGDGHMRGMSCLLTATELFPGNIQGGSDTPAGWAKGISIDQEIKNFLQSKPQTQTRFGSLEFGVAVPDRADPWTRMSYAGPNQPVAPISDPYQMFEKLHGRPKDKETLKSVLGPLETELQQAASQAGAADDRRLLEEHLTYVRQMQQDLARAEKETTLNHPRPELEPGLAVENGNIPKHSRMQIDLLVNALANDVTRVATLQYQHSVSDARMRWLGIEEGHHTLSHEPDSNTKSVESLTKINTWFCEELAYFLRRLSEISEPAGHGTLLDNTLVVWTNELGKGNNHTLDGIPLVLVGGGCDFQMGRALAYENTPHNRLWMSIAHAFGHKLDTFGNPKHCEGGPLDLT